MWVQCEGKSSAPTRGSTLTVTNLYDVVMHICSSCLPSRSITTLQGNGEVAHSGSPPSALIHIDARSSVPPNVVI